MCLRVQLITFTVSAAKEFGGPPATTVDNIPKDATAVFHHGAL